MNRRPFEWDISHANKRKTIGKSCFSYRFTDEDAEGGKHVLVVSDYVSFYNMDKNDDFILTEEESEVVFNVIRHAIKKKGAAKPRRVDFINWNNGLTQIRNASALDREEHLYYHARVMAFIKKAKPDVVLFCGLDAFNDFCKYAYKQTDERVSYKLKMHNLLDFKAGDHECKIIGTVDIVRPATQKPDEVKKYANLLGFLVESFTYAFNVNNPYTFSLGKTKHVYIDTFAKWRKIFNKVVKRAPVLAIDSEGLSLVRIVNKLYSIQFAASRKKAYFLPLDHPETPFSPKELAMIKADWKEYFERGGEDGLISEHIYHFAKHDLGQFITQFNVKWYCHKVFDTMAGAQALEENRKMLSSVGIKKPFGPFSLKTLTEYYGCDVYSRIGFDKGNRSNMDSVHLDHDFIEYGCYDVLTIQHMRRLMLKQAKDKDHHRYHTFVTELMTETIVSLAMMEHNGLSVDKKYLMGLRRPDSTMSKQIDETRAKFFEFKSVKTTNKKLLKKKNVPPGFKETRIFNINAYDDKQVLFFDVLKLDPISLTKGGGGKTDKFFQQHYKDIEEVALFTLLQKLVKLKSTYVDGIFEKLANSLDCSDGRLRCFYVFEDILTGRLGSRDPNLQNIPSHGELAKIIKRIFASRIGKILGKNDFNAHEVRSWANMGRDKRLQTSFAFGLNKRLKLRVAAVADKESYESWQRIKKEADWKNIKDANKKKDIVRKINDPAIKAFAQLDFDIEVNGDIHKLNCELFFGTPVLEVTDVQRQSVKAVVFGVLYGKTAAGLAVALGISEADAQKLIDLMFEKFEQGGEFITDAIQSAQKDLFFESPVGFRRHLWAYLHNKQAVRNSMDRRAVNTPIQGVSSEMGVSSVYYYNELAWRYFLSQGMPYPTDIVNNDVHDAIEWEVDFHLLPFHLYMMEHASSTMIHKRYNKLYGMEFGVGLELEFQMGPSLDAIQKFDWRLEGAIEKVKYTIDKQAEYFGVKQDEKAIIKALKHNWKLVEPFRIEEIEKTLRNEEVAKRMLLKPSMTKDLGIRWTV